MAKEKKKKIASSSKPKVVVTAEEKSKLKAEMKALKVEKGAAIEAKDKKKLKGVRFKLKRLNAKLRRMSVPAQAAPAKEEPKPEAAA